MTRYRQLLETSLALAGPFAFIQALLFRPRMLTPYKSGALGIVPVELQTLVAVGILFAACFVLRPERWRHPLGWLAVLGVGLPGAAVALVLGIQDVYVAPVVACFLSVASAALLRAALVLLPFSRSSTLADYGLSAIVSLCVSSLLSHIGYVTSVNDAFGTVGLSLQVLLSGVLLAAFVGLRGQKRKLEAEEPMAAAKREGDRWRRQEKAGEVLGAIGPVAPAGLICSLSLGLSVYSGSLEAALRLSVPFVLGSLMAVAILAALVLRWWRRSEEQDGDIALFMTIPCALAIAAACLAGALDFGLVFALLVCSNLVFLGLLWIDMLYLAGRRLLAFSAAPIAALLAVLAVFCLGMLASGMLPSDLMTVVAPLGAVAYLVYLVFYFHGLLDRPKWEKKEGAELAGEALRPRLSYDELRLTACRSMADEYELSPKEAEVLPLLVTGISAAAIGRQLFISHETVKTHKYHIYQKLGVHNYEEALEVFSRYANALGEETAAEASEPASSG